MVSKWRSVELSQMVNGLRILFPRFQLKCYIILDTRVVQRLIRNLLAVEVKSVPNETHE